jgi:hypothetical protein
MRRAYLPDPLTPPGRGSTAAIGPDARRAPATPPSAATPSRASSSPALGSVAVPLPRSPMPWPSTQNTSARATPTVTAPRRSRPRRSAPSPTAPWSATSPAPTPMPMPAPVTTRARAPSLRATMAGAPETAPTSASWTARALSWAGSTCRMAPSSHVAAKAGTIHVAGGAPEPLPPRGEEPPSPISWLDRPPAGHAAIDSTT